MKRFGLTAVLLLIQLLPAIAVGQGLDSRTFDTLPNARTKSLEQPLASEEKKQSLNAAKSQRSIGPTCPVSGKSLRSTDSRYCSVILSIGVGLSARGTPISLCETELTPDTYTPHALGGPGEGPELEVIFVPSGNAFTPYTMRQLKSPETFIDIVPLNRWEYDIRFYHSEESVVTRSQLEKGEGLKFIPGVSPSVPVSLYNVTGEPFAIWRFRNPNPPATDRLQINKIKNGVAETSEYVYVAATDTWTMTNNEGQVVYLKTSEINISDPCQRTEILEKKDRGLVIHRRTRVFRGFAWGQEIVKQVDEENGEAKTTAYTFYQDPEEKDSYSRVESVTNPDGSWEKYDYQYDQKGFFGRLMKVVVATGAPGTSKPQ